MAIKQIAHKVGIDKSIAYSSAGNIIGAFSNFLILFLVSLYLTKEEQGYYFTFGSILAIQSFFDLGLTGIMTQYVAHEQAHLVWDEDGISMVGEDKYKSRLSYLLFFCVKWYAIVATLFMITLIIAGIVFFTHYGTNDNVSWSFPWILVSIGTGVNLFLAPIMAIITGLGLVKEVMRIRFYKILLIPTISCIGLILGWNLYVLGIAAVLTAVYNICQISFSRLGAILRNIWRESITERVSYMKEIFPYQWKIALSWISGYFIFQLFNPVLFATEGATVAGQMGMSIQVLSGIGGLAMAWINTKVPLFSNLIELKKYKELDAVFYRTLKQELLVCLSLLVFFYILASYISYTHLSIGDTVLSERILPMLPLLLMILPLFANQFTFSFATYLRCHKQEPYLIMSVTMGILTMLSTLILGNYFGLYGICFGYCSLILFINTPWAYITYKNKKTEWHKHLN